MKCSLVVDDQHIDYNICELLASQAFSGRSRWLSEQDREQEREQTNAATAAVTQKRKSTKVSSLDNTNTEDTIQVQVEIA